MDEANNPPAGPIPHDGWKSRKLIAGLIATASVFVTSGVGWLVLERMSAAEWTSAQSVVVMPMFFITIGALTAEKWAAKGR